MVKCLCNPNTCFPESAGPNRGYDVNPADRAWTRYPIPPRTRGPSAKRAIRQCPRTFRTSSGTRNACAAHVNLMRRASSTVQPHAQSPRDRPSHLTKPAKTHTYTSLSPSTCQGRNEYRASYTRHRSVRSVPVPSARDLGTDQRWRSRHRSADTTDDIDADPTQSQPQLRPQPQPRRRRRH